MLKKQWKKVLYEKQDFCDNYTDPEKFLDSLDQSVDVKNYTLTSAFMATSLVVQQIAIVATFLAVDKYVAIDESISWLLSLNMSIVLLGLAIHYFLGPSGSFNLSTVWYYCLIFGLSLRLLAPVLMALTSSYSSDTIHALVIFFSFVRCISFDYGFISGERDKSDEAISLNSSMFLAVLLASRFHNVNVVVLLMLLATLSFALSSLPLRYIRLQTSTLHFVIFTTFLAGVPGYLLYHLQTLLFIIYTSIVVFVGLLCPLGGLYMHRFVKKSMHGPWDTATLHVPNTNSDTTVDSTTSPNAANTP